MIIIIIIIVLTHSRAGPVCVDAGHDAYRARVEYYDFIRLWPGFTTTKL